MKERTSKKERRKKYGEINLSFEVQIFFFTGGMERRKVRKKYKKKRKEFFY